MRSCLYRGVVRHRRFAPKPHAFDYSMFMVYLDLAELDRVFDGRWLWSVEKANVASYRREDQPGGAGSPLDAWARDLVEEETGRRPTGPVRLLTHLRYLGYCFNPVSFLYCFDADDEHVETIVADVGNTPWNEHHPYVFRVDHDAPEPYRFRFDKAFHVSPFQDMDSLYDWRFPPPGEQLKVHMECLREGTAFFDATLTMERRSLDGSSLARALARFPVMTAKIIWGIYWQAFRLWCKRMPFYDHPRLRGAEASA